ncbi:hypothetical protein ON010_g11306 [Phytophthora cinnamomi]|nr:hypothetical protein ON010_g11306 [Phytophthora cinnamomi]
MCQAPLAARKVAASTATAASCEPGGGAGPNDIAARRHPIDAADAATPQGHAEYGQIQATDPRAILSASLTLHRHRPRVGSDRWRTLQSRARARRCLFALARPSVQPVCLVTFFRIRLSSAFSNLPAASKPPASTTQHSSHGSPAGDPAAPPPALAAARRQVPARSLEARELPPPGARAHRAA